MKKYLKRLSTILVAMCLVLSIFGTRSEAKWQAVSDSAMNRLGTRYSVSNVKSAKLKGNKFILNGTLQKMKNYKTLKKRHFSFKIAKKIKSFGAEGETLLYTGKKSAAYLKRICNIKPPQFGIDIIVKNNRIMGVFTCQ